MSWQCTSWALREAPAPTATARLVLIALADRCQPDGRSAWPTVDTLMLEAHTSESSVKRALKALEETGCIRRGNQKLAQWDEHGNYVPEPYRSVVWECCMNVTLEHVSEKPGRQARAERAERAERDGDGNAEQAGKADRFRGVKMTPLENGGNKPKSRGVKMTPLNPEREARGVTSDTSRGVTGDTPIVRTNPSKQISPLPPTEASPCLLRRHLPGPGRAATGKTKPPTSSKPHPRRTRRTALWASPTTNAGKTPAPNRKSGSPPGYAPDGSSTGSKTAEPPWA